MKPTSLLVLAATFCLAQTLMAGDRFPPFLYAAEGAQKIIRYGSKGEVVWEYPAPMARDVWALPNGNVLFCFNRDYGSTKHDTPSGVMELDPADKIIWSVEGKDLPELGIRWFAGIQVLPNGNIFVCNAGGRVPFFELARDKRIVWQNPSGMAIPLGHGLQRLDIGGEPRR